ncbi:Crinkler (CRN) family protein [Phytophthora cinnamomi]|uniref:Crinkler (CRN) family protein n=1 Tax=Phytophthora cinnamomi TaxID=4785 RepID=UPI00355A67DE|nr:Crinkler (CRN) family protein [Phytophthora cinnamomi]
MYEQTVLGKRKVYRHSSASSTLLTELNVRLQATRAVRFATGDLTHAAPFRWESISDERGQNIALTEEQQRERYRAYVEINIGDVLTRNRLCVYGVEKGKDILKAEIPGHNIELVGRTDMIILSDLVLENPLDLGMLPGVRLLIEVKRKVKERAISQALSALIALDVLVDEPVMALLTDLTDHWQFFWVSDTINNHGNIRSVTIRDPSEAFAVIRTLLNQSPSADAEIRLPCFQEPVKRQKLSRVLPSIAEASGSGIRECIERYYDIASMLGPDIEMARSVARQVTRSIPTLSYFS